MLRSFLPESLESRLQEGIQHAVTQGAAGAEAFVSVSRSRKAKVQNGQLEDLTSSSVAPPNRCPASFDLKPQIPQIN